MLVSKYLPDNYPPRWSDYRSAHGLVDFSTKLSRAADVNRFGNRYRFAKSCSVNLAGYSAGTAAGYNAIVKVALCWSAFEALLTAIRLGKHGVATVSARHDSAPVLDQMRAAGEVLPFFKFVAIELDSKGQKAEVEKFVAGKACCGLTLAKAVRHIFFHGTLTPNARQAEAADVAVACTLLADWLIGVMDAEFSAAVDELLATATSMFPPQPFDPFDPFSA